MQDVPGSQGVSRLKELLFEPENQALSELQQRIDALSRSERAHHQELMEKLTRLVSDAETERGALMRRIADSDEQERQERGRLTQQLAVLEEHERKERLELVRRIEGLFERTGTEERFRASVASALDGALRQAEVDRHAELSAAIAPLVVRTIKTEIRNSQDELAEALYPHMGRMVKAYIASAMKDLAEQLNRRIESNPVMLRIRSLTTGRPVAELAMSDMMRLQVEEIYLIQRGTGELAGRWPEALGSSNRDHVVGGTLSAINEFAADAFEGDGTSLRRVDLGSAQIYLRASPLYLLAAKCSGSAPAAIEQVIDEAFLGFIETHKGEFGGATVTPTTPGEAASEAPLARLADALQQRVADRQAEIAVPPLGFGPLKWAAAIILFPLLGWLGWSTYQDVMTSRTLRTAEATLAATAELAGYPTRIEVVRGGGALTVTGLAPTADARAASLANLRMALPGADIRERLTVLPNSATESARQIAEIRRSVTGLEGQVSGVGQSVSSMEREVGTVGQEVKAVSLAAAGVRRDLAGIQAELDRSGVRRTLLRAASRLDQTVPDLQRLAGELPAPSERANVQQVATRSLALRDEIETWLKSSENGAGGGLSETIQPLVPRWHAALAQQADQLSGLIGQPRAVSAGGEVPRRERSSVAELAEDVAAGVERLATLTAAVGQANALRQSLPPPVVPVVQQTPRDRLAAFVRDNAVFFGNGTDYRNAGPAERTIDTLAALVKDTEALVRVVGYTDERGGQQRNQPLSQSRADKVLEALVQRGVARERLVAIGRVNSIDLSPSTGVGNPNRRVEFEIGFDGEQGGGERGP
jgi:outer membrane protein OmpA-like peptidoglycan-associated protein